MLFENFLQKDVKVNDVTLKVTYGGQGKPLLLLHGHPQTHVMWHKIAPLLAKDFFLIIPDLRGYGDSSKPITDEKHITYSKREMAKDFIELMHFFSYDKFYVAGHDRGARCAYRLSLDFPDSVLKLAVLDIIPTLEAFNRVNKKFAMGFWGWFFLAQPYDLPEKIISQNPDLYYFQGDRSIFDPEALEEYFRCINKPGTIHAMCEDYRAGASIDCEIDKEDKNKKKITCPVLVLWSSKGELPQWYDVIEIWKEWADDVKGKGIDCGHYLAEEAPEVIYNEFYNFFK